MIVYLLKNRASGKIYVGQTGHPTLARRWAPSLSNSANPHLRAAIRKYGPESFTRTILAYASCQQELDLLEKFFITIFQTTNRRYGYNLQKGGLTGTGRHTPETIERIRDGNKRHWDKKSQAELIRYAENARLRWDMWSEERKQKWAEDCRARYWSRPPKERERAIHLVRQNTLGLKRSVPGWNKGLLGWNAGHSTSPETKERLSLALKQHWAQKGVGSVKDDQIKNKRTVAAMKQVEEAKRQLREITDRVNALKFELKGGCTW